MQNGYVKIFRKLLDNPIIMKDADHLAVWIYLLLNATHKNIDAVFKGERITLQPGQLITGSKSIGVKLNINYVKVHRIINEFKSEKQIEKQTSNKNSLISILNWYDYQDCEKQNEIQMKSKCKTNEIQVKTNNNDNNVIMKEYKEKYKRESLPDWFDKDFEKDDENIDELEKVLEEFR